MQFDILVLGDKTNPYNQMIIISIGKAHFFLFYGNLARQFLQTIKRKFCNILRFEKAVLNTILRETNAITQSIAYLTREY